jgi:phage terminase small subunit
MTKNGGLTPKQEAFCLAYVETGNASEAYRRAYDTSRMKDGVIRVKACEVMAHEAVDARIAELRATMVKRHEVTVDRIVQELAKIAFANMLDFITVQSDGTAYVDLSKLTREQAAAMGEIVTEEYTEGRGEDVRPVKRVKFKLLDKLSALDKLGKHLGMFTDKHEHTGKDGAPLVPELPENRDLARVILSILSQAQIAKEDTPQ